MSAEETNLWGTIAHIRRGYFALVDGSTVYRYDQPVSIEFSARARPVVHYSTFGDKTALNTGNDNSVSVTVKETADLYDTTNSIDAAQNGVSTRSISYFIRKIDENIDLPEIICEYVTKSAGSPAKNLITRFSGHVTGVGRGRSEGLGVNTIALSVLVTRVEKAVAEDAA